MTCPYPCQNKTEYGYCKTTGCINPKFDRTRTFTWYDPIEIARAKGERGMSAKEMLEKVQELKEQVLFNGFEKTAEVDEFFKEYWMQILDMLDDALYAHLQGKV